MLTDASDLEELKRAFESGGVEGCRNKLESESDEWKYVPLNVAVTGNAGVGKSSFINAIRCLSADDEGAAEVGVTETTTQICSYPHPDHPMLKFWDLPGVGTDRFPRSTYLADIDVDSYDFFLLITAGSLTENDTWLGNELRSRNKKYFFVRTKIGVDISSNKEAHPRTHNEEAVLKIIRESIQQNLRENGFQNVPIFFIDNYMPEKFEFGHLERRLVEDFPKLLKTALVLSLPATNEEMIRLKVAELRSRIWKRAAVSGLVALAPVPGLSVAFDLSLVVKETDVYLSQLGLDDTSLRRYAKLMSCDYEKLRSVVDSNLGYLEAGVSGAKMIETILKLAAPLVAAAELEEGSRFIPIIGPFIAAPLSFGGTYYALKMILDKMESVALDVVKSARDDIELCDDVDY